MTPVNLPQTPGAYPLSPLDCRISCIEIGRGFILFHAAKTLLFRLNPRMQHKGLTARPFVFESPASFLRPVC